MACSGRLDAPLHDWFDGSSTIGWRRPRPRRRGVSGGTSMACSERLVGKPCNALCRAHRVQQVFTEGRVRALLLAALLVASFATVARAGNDGSSVPIHPDASLVTSPNQTPLPAPEPVVAQPAPAPAPAPVVVATPWPENVPSLKPGTGSAAVTTAATTVPSSKPVASTTTAKTTTTARPRPRRPPPRRARQRRPRTRLHPCRRSSPTCPPDPPSR